MTIHRVVQKIIRGNTFEIIRPVEGCRRIRIIGLDEPDGNKLKWILKKKVAIYPLSKRKGTLSAMVSYNGHSLTKIILDGIYALH